MNEVANPNPLFNRIKKNVKALKPFLKDSGITCYRVFDWDMPEYPLCIDYYNGHIHVAEYQTRHPLNEEQYQTWLSDSLSAIKTFFNVNDSFLHLKLRERKKGSNQYEKVNSKQQLMTVTEQGVSFLVNLDDYLDTGLFLDHRPLRKRVMQEAKGKHVLNLFAYTGSFSVYAAMGEAFTTTTVDLSNTYLNWAKENFKLNGIALARHSFIKADVKQWIKQNPVKLYDLIVLDPPTMSRSSMAKTKFDVQEDHVELINHTLNHLKPGGVLYFSNNYRNFVLHTAEIQASHIDDISLATIPADFRNKKIHSCWRIIK